MFNEVAGVIKCGEREKERALDFIPPMISDCDDALYFFVQPRNNIVKMAKKIVLISKTSELGHQLQQKLQPKPRQMHTKKSGSNGANNIYGLQ